MSYADAINSEMMTRKEALNVRCWGAVAGSRSALLTKWEEHQTHGVCQHSGTPRTDAVAKYRPRNK